MTTKPLSGLTVVAIEQAVAAPFCTARLVDGGARVIKIEREGGETARHYDSAVDGTSTYFTWLNRGKESVVLNLKSYDDLELLNKLLSKADVLVQNLAPGAIDRMGLSAIECAEKFPNLIHVSIGGYGSKTDYSDMKAYDLLVQAESGICAVTGSPQEPAKVGVPIADISTGMNAHASILEALIERGITGKGKAIEISMFDCMAEWITVPLLHYRHSDYETERFGMGHASVYPYRPFECTDGTIIIAVQTQAEWKSLCEQVLKMPELFDREEFANNAARVKNRVLLDSEMEPVFSSMATSEMINLLKQAKIAYARFSTIRDLPDHPALREIEVELANETRVKIPTPAGRNASFEQIKIPELGEHTEKLRKELG